MRKLLGLVCVVSLGLMAAACGSSGSSDGSGDADKAATTTEATSSTAAPGGQATGTQAEYLAALVTNLTTGSTADGNLVVAKDEGACVASAWLKTVTVDGLTGAGVTPEALSDPNFKYSLLKLDDAQAQAMIDAFESCKVDIYAKLAESFTVGLTKEQQACAEEKVDPKVANALLLTAFSTKSGDGSAEFTALLDQLTTACDLPSK